MSDQAEPDRFSDVADRSGDLPNRITEQTRSATQSMQAVAGNFKDALDKSLKHQPEATLAVTAILGFLLGGLWKS